MIKILFLTIFLYIYFRNYSGPTSQSGTDYERKSRIQNNGNRGGGYSPVIEMDEDSNTRYFSESVRQNRGPGTAEKGGIDKEDRNKNDNNDGEDSEWRRDIYCAPRNTLLSLTADFILKCSAKMAEINKKDRGGARGGGTGEADTKATGDTRGSFDLLDTRCYMKLVDVAHTLLKMAPYDLGCIKAKGIEYITLHH